MVPVSFLSLTPRLVEDLGVDKLRHDYRGFGVSGLKKELPEGRPGVPLQLRRVQSRPECDTHSACGCCLATQSPLPLGGFPKTMFPVLGSDGGWQRAWPSRPVAGHLLSG